MYKIKDETIEINISEMVELCVKDLKTIDMEHGESPFYEVHVKAEDIKPAITRGLREYFGVPKEGMPILVEEEK